MRFVAAFLLMALSLPSSFSFASEGDRGILPSKRGLVVISNLSSMRKAAHWVAYRLEEKKAVEVVDAFTRAHYGQRIFLEPREATQENFFQALRDLEANPEVQVIDVIVYLHGLPGRLCFKGQIGKEGKGPCLPMTQVSEQIQALGTEGGPMKKLRMLYSDACYGESHLEDWLRAGFRVVNGSLLQDANKAWDLRAFLRQWTRGKTYGAAMDRANHLAITRVMDRIVGGKSFKETSGDLEITISTP